MDTLATCTLPISTFRAALSAASPHASTDALQPHMHGVSLQLTDGALTVCATDGHRLFKFVSAPVSDLALVPVDADIPDALVPLPQVAELIKALPRKPSVDACSVGLARESGITSVRVSFASACVKVVCPSEQFPAYKKIIPPLATPTVPRFCAMNPDYLKEACEAVKMLEKLTSKETSGVCVCPGPDVLAPITILAPGVTGLTIVIMPMRTAAEVGAPYLRRSPGGM